MYKWIIVLLLFSSVVKGQELNCTVKVNFDRITDANPQIFKTLEKSLNDFVNNTRWTTRNFGKNEKIDCSMVINVSSFNNTAYSATIQVQSSRTAFNSAYASPVLNHMDKDFSFNYNEFENLIYNPNSFDSNLVGVIAFYANIIIGLDADTYQKAGGTDYYQQAQNIVGLAQQSGYKGWSAQDGNQNRYFLANDVLSNTYTPFRDALYEYHFTGIDNMADNPKLAKQNIAGAVKTLLKVYNVRPNSFIVRLFFDAKSDELVGIYSGGPMTVNTDLVETLNKVSPLNSSKWSTIK